MRDESHCFVMNLNIITKVVTVVFFQYEARSKNCTWILSSFLFIRQCSTNILLIYMLGYNIIGKKYTIHSPLPSNWSLIGGRFCLLYSATVMSCLWMLKEFSCSGRGFISFALLLCIMRMAGALIVTKWRHGFNEATKLGTHGVLIALKFDAKDTRLTNWASKIPSHFDVVTLSIEKQFCYRLESFCPRLLQWYLKIRSH